MFKGDPGSTFSDNWYRVGPLRPRLNPHAQIIRQDQGGRAVYIVEDPAGGQFYRLSPPAYFFLGLLDGRRTVNEAWDACNAQLGDDAPTQRECTDLLGKLQLYGLLDGGLPLAADMVLERKRQVRAKRLLKRTGRWMVFTLPLLNPEPWLQRFEHLIRPFYSRWGFAVWCVVVAAGLWGLISRWSELGNELNFAELLDPANLVWLSLLFVALRAAHELGHATACKAMGGRSTEIGLMLIAGVIPLPYCDATSAWRFPEVWRRVVVSAAGMYVEVFLAAVAAIIWATTDPGRVHALAYNMMLVAGFTTIVFNANPLLRYDGYYILSDVAGAPNLAQRSREFWTFVIERGAFGVRGTRPPAVRGRGEAWLLGVYGLLSQPYRIFITCSILLLISSMYLTVGLLLAVVLAAAWLVWPMLKGLAYLAASPRLVGRRGRAIGLTASIALVLVVGLGVVPAPAAGYASAVLGPSAEAGLRATEDGFVRRVLVRIGDHVEAGQPVVELENPELERDLAIAEAQLERARAERDAAMLREPGERRVADARVESAEAMVARARARVEALMVRAPISGRLAASGGSGRQFEQCEGMFAQRGGLLAMIVAAEPPVVRAVVSDRERAYIFRDGDADPDGPWPRPTVRVRGDAGRELPASIVRVVPAGSRDVPDRSLLTLAGGDVLPDPEDPDQRRTLVPHFIVELTADGLAERPTLGRRAMVRFGVEPEPLASQWWRRARQFLSAKFSL